MSEIKRYDTDAHGYEAHILSESADGEWVTYSDHLASLTTAESEIARLRGEVEERTRERDALRSEEWRDVYFEYIHTANAIMGAWLIFADVFDAGGTLQWTGDNAEASADRWKKMREITEEWRTGYAVPDHDFAGRESYVASLEADRDSLRAEVSRLTTALSERDGRIRGAREILVLSLNDTDDHWHRYVARALAALEAGEGDDCDECPDYLGHGDCLRTKGNPQAPAQDCPRPDAGDKGGAK